MPDSTIVTQGSEAFLPPFLHKEERKTAKTLGFEIPRGWSTFATVFLPPGWEVRDEGILKTYIRDPENRRRVRVVKIPEQRDPNKKARCELLGRYMVGNVLLTKTRLQYYVFDMVRSNPDRLQTEKDLHLLFDCVIKKPQEFDQRKVVAVERCARFLDQHYPNWRDPLAYWDE